MRKALTISIEEEDFEAIKLLCEKTGLTQSKLFESHVKGLAKAARASGLLDKKKASKLDLFKMLFEGAKLEV